MILNETKEEIPKCCNVKESSMSELLPPVFPQCLENVRDLLPGWFLWFPVRRPGRAGVCLQGAVNHQAVGDLPQAGGMFTPPQSIKRRRDL